MLRDFAGVIIWVSIATASTGLRASLQEGDAALQRGDYAAALVELRPDAERGNADAQIRLAFMYMNGLGVVRDDKKAFHWMDLAARQGSAIAQNVLALMYRDGEGVAQDYKQAVRWFRFAADQGNADAQKSLGFMYAKGYGVTTDRKEAARLFHLAANQGNAEAQTNLGAIYRNGEGVPKDYQEALKWFRLAAEQRDANAEFAMGLMHMDGQGVVEDMDQAVKWFRLAADQGHTTAQFNLGVLYANRHDLSGSRILAYAIYNLSAANDLSPNSRAASSRDVLARSMSTQEIEAAQDLARVMAKPGNFLAVLDEFEAQSQLAKDAAMTRTPLHPAKR